MQKQLKTVNIYRTLRKFQITFTNIITCSQAIPFIQESSECTQIYLEAQKEKNLIPNFTSVADNRLSPLSLPTPESESFLLGYMPSILNSFRKESKWQSSEQHTSTYSKIMTLLYKFLLLSKSNKSVEYYRILRQGPTWAPLMAQLVKNLPAMQESWVRCLGWEDPLEKETATHSSILARKISWTEEPGRLQSMGL